MQVLIRQHDDILVLTWRRRSPLWGRWAGTWLYKALGQCMGEGIVMEPGWLWIDLNGLFKWLMVAWKRMVAREIKWTASSYLLMIEPKELFCADVRGEWEINLDFWFKLKPFILGYMVKSFIEMRKIRGGTYWGWQRGNQKVLLGLRCLLNIFVEMQPSPGYVCSVQEGSQIQSPSHSPKASDEIG